MIMTVTMVTVSQLVSWCFDITQLYDTIQYNFIAKRQMHKECIVVPSTLTRTLTPVTHTHKHYSGKNVKVVQRVDLIRLKR